MSAIYNYTTVSSILGRLWSYRIWRISRSLQAVATEEQIVRSDRWWPVYPNVVCFLVIVLKSLVFHGMFLWFPVFILSINAEIYYIVFQLCFL